MITIEPPGCYLTAAAPSGSVPLFGSAKTGIDPFDAKNNGTVPLSEQF
jgi:hypothetical protein